MIVCMRSLPVYRLVCPRDLCLNLGSGESSVMEHAAYIVNHRKIPLRKFQVSASISEKVMCT